jgi:hypothetical protein
MTPFSSMTQTRASCSIELASTTTIANLAARREPPRPPEELKNLVQSANQVPARLPTWFAGLANHELISE